VPFDGFLGEEQRVCDLSVRRSSGDARGNQVAGGRCLKNGTPPGVGDGLSANQLGPGPLSPQSNAPQF
jgi:hypothetical protein